MYLIIISKLSKLYNLITKKTKLFTLVSSSWFLAIRYSISFFDAQYWAKTHSVVVSFDFDKFLIIVFF